MTDTLPEINKELFQKVYDQISSEPETHEQWTWEDSETANEECGTTRCVAGWAVFFGHNLEHGQSIYCGYGDGSAWRHPSIQREAAHLLGLTDNEAAHLFLSTNNSQARELVLRYATKGRSS